MPVIITSHMARDLWAWSSSTTTPCGFSPSSVSASWPTGSNFAPWSV